MLSKSEVFEAVKAANAARFEAAPASGCGRAYVCVSGSKEEVAAVAAACKSLGLMFLKKAYGTGGNAIYCGYDNADGRALGKSKVMAEVLSAAGLRAYSDAVGD